VANDDREFTAQFQSKSRENAASSETWREIWHRLSSPRPHPRETPAMGAPWKIGRRGLLDSGWGKEGLGSFIRWWHPSCGPTMYVHQVWSRLKVKQTVYPVDQRYAL